MIRALAVVVLIASCGNKRVVTIKSENPDVAIDVLTDTDGIQPGEPSGAIRVRVEHAGAIVPVIIIPIPVPYAKSTALAEKP